MNIHALRTGERTLHALDLARRIEAGELTPAAVLASCEQAIAAREAEIGAFAALDLPRAKKSAASSAGPLRGLPVGVKDIFDTVDFPTECGSSIYAGHRPRTDAAVVSQVRRAGGGSTPRVIMSGNNNGASGFIASSTSMTCGSTS